MCAVKPVTHLSRDLTFCFKLAAHAIFQKVLTVPHARQVEKHIRKNNLTVTFTDQLGQAKHSEHVTGEKEARKLAFYLFWNIKPYFTR